MGVDSLILALNLPSQCTLILASNYTRLSLNLQTYQSYDIYKLLINLIQFFFYESKYFVSLTLAKCLMCRIYLCNYVLPGRLCRYSPGIHGYTSATMFYLADYAGILHGCKDILVQLCSTWQIMQVFARDTGIY